MATSTQDSPQTGTASQPSDGYATSQAVQYIRNLRATLQKTSARLDKVQATYHLAIARQSDTQTKFQEARNQEEQAKTNLAEATDAQTKLESVTDFFKTRQIITAEMTSHAKQMAQSMFEALQYLGREGVQRIEDISSAVDAFNKIPENADSQWTPLFIEKVQAANSKGKVAMEDGHAAVKAAFAAFVGNLQINFRAQQYYQQFHNLSAELTEVIHRLSREHTLAKKNLTLLKGQKDAIDDQVDQLEESLQELQFETVQLQAEYTAAHQGASYSIAEASQGG